ncbi:probable basic-leucine zipper transcription factor C isoform X5 [Anopheles albimanus]|uniref:probable basic-leucine zipper transcription factor C isoform X5 n=1 Tax=Anopheles albimanus TaxID=7167 RepID=UPI00163F48ED|nr:probable basic-leucine zipper transcription factor C isoform X5 [Anopheles albimanus]XP_035784999.1 probable basic-leucine zipper transcription factor C isoform X5 [Anopheles albimanus]
MQAVSAMNMEFQPLPPVSTMNIGPPAPSPSPHQLQMLTNVPNGNGGGGGGGGGGSGAGGGGGGHNGLGNGSGVHSQLLGPMPPPSILPIGMPLQQVVHNLQHLTNVGGLGMGGNPQQQQQPQQQHQQQQQQQHQQQQQTHQNLLTSNTPGVGNNGLTAIHHGGTQNLPPTSQLLQAIHQNTSNNNNNNGGSGNNNNNNNNNSNTINLNNSNSNINSNNSNNNNNNNTITQYQVQQLWRHHAYLNGKTSNSKDICGEDKHKEEGDPWNVDAHSAFLGPNLWDKTLPYDSDLKVHQVSEYADLDEFLSENGIPYDGLPSSHLGNSTSLTSQRSDSLGHCAGLSLSGLSQVTTKRERSPSPSDCMSPETMNPPSPADSIFDVPAFSMSSTRDFDPRTRAFSDEELKPQPMIKKSRKQFVPDEMKDDKYWARRRKNNMAAKRSRDARRMKENQIALRAGYLEKENMNLHREVEQLKQENMELRARLSKYQEV